MTPRLAELDLGEDKQAALSALPRAAGIAQFIGDAGRVLLTGSAANLRSWAASRLGRGRPPRPGRRPALDLSPIARSLRYGETTSGFHQRLLFERLMGEVPLEQRRDLRTPAWLHIDARARFPRLSARSGPPLAGDFGPFRDARAAERAREALHAAMPLRPCDFEFEPAADLDLGLRCVFAQVASCAAPCLRRISEDDYRALARTAACELEAGAAEWRPRHVGRRIGQRGLVAERGTRGLELYPIRDGRVDEAAARSVDDAGASAAIIEAAAALQARVDTVVATDDWPWLLVWLAQPRRRGVLVTSRPEEAPDRMAERVARALDEQ